MSEIKNEEEADETMSTDSSEHPLDGTDDNAPIWPPRHKKRRRRAYLDFSKVAETFPNSSTDVVCQLAEMEVVKPSNVLQLVPEATTEQIASFLHIAEEGYGEKKEAAGHEHGFAQPDAIATQLAWLKEEALKSSKKPRDMDSPTVENSQVFKELQKLVPPADGGTGSVSVNFTQKFQEKIIGLLGSSSSPNNFNPEHFEYIYEKLLRDPLARAWIENLHAARAHKYGHAQFGAKHWYRDSLNMAKKMEIAKWQKEISDRVQRVNGFFEPVEHDGL